ncbi:Hypothetical protein A7982_07954 [Minicystis rosea]|nr:Hypothetical protein A7982_07954 [Minicystis rosea]
MAQSDDAFLAGLRAEAARLDLDEIRSELETALETPDPVLAEAVAAGLARYEHALTPQGLDEARRLVTAKLLCDPEARKVLDLARAQRGSGTVKKQSTEGLVVSLKKNLAGR